MNFISNYQVSLVTMQQSQMVLKTVNENRKSRLSLANHTGQYSFSKSHTH
jgi:hypothetical protein